MAAAGSEDAEGAVGLLGCNLFLTIKDHAVDRAEVAKSSFGIEEGLKPSEFKKQQD